ncbi:C40 family peptidase [Formosa sp. A9]|uniref:C40 family peptidase n=1 Tax=Formosa sp. A9 TaxID=3442641 RepID=UPI003EBE36D7
MRILPLLITFCICLSSCKSSKTKNKYTATTPTETHLPSGNIPTSPYDENSAIAPESEADLVVLSNEIIDYAKQFEGVKYKFGGTTKSGMDCSGLVYESFRAYNITLPRVSRDMATKGTKIDLDEVREGDLLFFETNPKQKRINHVGLVVSARTGSVEFIHSTTSKGVITSSLAERYWYYSFKEARRIL